MLISSDFLDSDYCYDKEMGRALEKHHNGEARVIPIIVRSADWNTAPFAKLQALPQEGKPIDSWRKKDKAWTDVAKGIRKVVEELSGQSKLPPIQDISEPRKPVWNIPLERNPFFTGREDILGEIRAALLSSGRAAFSGLGGIGKTQTAVEYAYRHKDDYSHILWVKADSKESLTLDFAQLAQLLNLPEKHAQDQQEIVKAVRRWLQQHDQWLLILDNADDLSLTHPFIQGLQSGNILLTTKAQATGTISRVEVRKLPEQEGAVFLLRRAKLITKDTPYETISQDLRTQALAITRELDGLPLALDQAGAYIEETQCGLADYLGLYRTHGVKLLKERGLFAPGHPDPVATTWALSFHKIEQANPAAAELLTFCGFLHPDSIPEELITKGATELGPVLGPVAENSILFNKAIGEILKFSLIHREMNSKTLDIHRLVQTVILSSLEDEAKIQWIERFVRGMKHVFPKVEFENWPLCDRLLSQAKQLALLNKTANLRMPEAAKVLNQTALYLRQRSRFSESEALYQESLSIYEEKFGYTHPYVGITLTNLADLYRIQGRYKEAEPLFLRSISILEEPSDEKGYIILASSLNNLAVLYQTQGKNNESEIFFNRVLKIREQILGATHLDVAQSLANLGGLFHIQGRDKESESLLKQALEIREKALGPTHPDVAHSLNNLAAVYYKQQNYDQAKSFYQRSLDIWEKALGFTHPDVANCLNNLGELHRNQGNHIEATPLHQRALGIREQIFGPIHPDVAQSLNNLGHVYLDQGRYIEAEPLLVRALAIRKQILGHAHPHVAQSLNNLGKFYLDQERYIEAEPLLVSALAIREQALEPTYPDIAQSLNNLAGLYRNQGKDAEAKPLFQRALKILEGTWGQEHPNTQVVRGNYEVLLKKMERENLENP